MFEKKTYLKDSNMSNTFDNEIIVSVIVPAKNEEGAVAHCLESLFSLEFSKNNMEIIFVDNGSTDNTVKIAESLGCNVFIKPDLKVGAVRNFGASIARGNILAFIDSDCVADKMWLKNAVSILNEDNNNVCVTGLIRIPENYGWVGETFSLNRTQFKDRCEKSYAPGSNIIIRKKIFEEVNGFSEHMSAGEDLDLSLKIRMKKHKIIYDKDVIVTHLDEPKTLMGLFRNERWHGYNAIDLLIPFIKDFKEYVRLNTFAQNLFFIFSFFSFLYFVLSGHLLLSILSFTMFILLPIVRAIVISSKNKTFSYFNKLILIWLIFYSAKSLAIFDYVFDKLARKQKKN